MRFLARLYILSMLYICEGTNAFLLYITCSEIRTYEGRVRVVTVDVGCSYSITIWMENTKMVLSQGYDNWDGKIIRSLEKHGVLICTIQYDDFYVQIIFSLQLMWLKLTKTRYAFVMLNEQNCYLPKAAGIQSNLRYTYMGITGCVLLHFRFHTTILWHMPVWTGSNIISTLRCCRIVSAHALRFSINELIIFAFALIHTGLRPDV